MNTTLSSILSILKYKKDDIVWEVGTDGVSPIYSVTRCKIIAFYSIHTKEAKLSEVSYDIKWKDLNFYCNEKDLFETQEKAKKFCNKINKKAIKRQKAENEKQIKLLEKEQKKLKSHQMAT